MNSKILFSNKQMVLILALFLLIVNSLFLTACQPAPTATAPTQEQIEETAQSYANKKIVWVDSYHESYEWSASIESGLKDALADTGVDLKVIRMDTKLNPSDEFGVEAGKQANTEIEAFAPDVIIACDDNAQKFLVVPYLMNSETPIIFCGVNWDASIYGYPTNNITGVIEVELPTELVDLLKMFATGSKIGYLTVESETESKVADIYNSQFFNNEMVLYSVKTLDDFKDAFIKAQDEVDILFMGNNAGLADWDQAEMETFIRDNASIPSGTINSWMTPYSLVTLAKRGEEQGDLAVKAALSVLDGTPINEIPVVENKEGQLILNFDLAERLDVVFTPSMLRNAEIYSSQEGSSE